MRKAYLQLHVGPKLWRYQAVCYKEKYYYLTRLGFGLNCAPRVMSVILAKVLELDTQVAKGTDHYIDNILVNKDIVSVQLVIDHLSKFGLKTKLPARLEVS